MDLTTVELQLACHAPITTDGVLAEDYAVLRWLDGERTKIK